MDLYRQYNVYYHLIHTLKVFSIHNLISSLVFLKASVLSQSLPSTSAGSSNDSWKYVFPPEKNGHV